MAIFKTGWLHAAGDADGEKRFAWSHVKSIFYNKAANVLLKDKLDEMDRLIDEKIAKAMMSNQQVNDINKVPTSALAYSMQQAITKNAGDITSLNDDLQVLNTYPSSVYANIRSLGVGQSIDVEFTPEISGTYLAIYLVCPCGHGNGEYSIMMYKNSSDNEENRLHIGLRTYSLVAVNGKGWDGQYAVPVFLQLKKSTKYIVRFTNRTDSDTDSGYDSTFGISYLPIRC